MQSPVTRSPERKRITTNAAGGPHGDRHANFIDFSLLFVASMRHARNVFSSSSVSTSPPSPVVPFSFARICGIEHAEVRAEVGRTARRRRENISAHGGSRSAGNWPMARSPLFEMREFPPLPHRYACRPMKTWTPHRASLPSDSRNCKETLPPFALHQQSLDLRGGGERSCPSLCKGSLRMDWTEKLSSQDFGGRLLLHGQ